MQVAHAQGMAELGDTTLQLGELGLFGFLSLLRRQAGALAQRDDGGDGFPAVFVEEFEQFAIFGELVLPDQAIHVAQLLAQAAAVLRRLQALDDQCLAAGRQLIELQQRPDDGDDQR